MTAEPIGGRAFQPTPCDCPYVSPEYRARRSGAHRVTCPNRGMSLASFRYGSGTRRRSRPSSRSDRGGGVTVWHGPLKLGGLSDRIGDTTVTREEWEAMVNDC